MADSAFIYKAQAGQPKYSNSMGGPEFERMSQRYEKDLGLGNDMDSLLSMERGGGDYQVSAPSRGESVSLWSTQRLLPLANMPSAMSRKTVPVSVHCGG